MEDDLNIFASRKNPQYFDKWKTTLIFSSSNGRQPQHFGKWKTTSFFQMEDDLNILENGRRFQNLANGRRLQYFGKWKTTSIFWKMEDDFKI